MSLPHFFLDNQILADESQPIFPLRLSSEDAKHARVLRLKPGEHVAVIDAVQDYFECEIVSVDKDSFSVRIAQRFDDPDMRACVVLVQGIAKGDKMGEIIKHATELGVDAFIPFMSERSIVKLDQKKQQSKSQRWQAVARSAAMQSGQRSVPEVTEPFAVDEVCAFVANAAAVLIFWEEAPSLSVREALENSLGAQSIAPEDARVVVVVGPEGGLTAQEVQTLCEANRHTQVVSLGPSILRTETAGVIAPALTLYELGRLQ